MLGMGLSRIRCRVQALPGAAQSASRGTEAAMAPLKNRQIPDQRRGTMWEASKTIGYDIHASDGAIGSLDDLLFDDAGWTIRWAVIDTGTWLPGRRVLLPFAGLAGHICVSGASPSISAANR